MQPEDTYSYSRDLDSMSSSEEKDEEHHTTQRPLRFKIVLLGAKEVGKTCLAQQLVYKVFKTE